MRIASTGKVMLLFLLVLLGCTGKAVVDTPPDPDGDLIPLDLSFALQGSGRTRADAGTLSELADQGRFRGMDHIRIIPFSVGAGEISASTRAIGDIRALPDIDERIDERAYSGSLYHSGLIRNNHAHLFSSAFAALPRGTDAVLVYGRAPRVSKPTVVQDKHFNGSLLETGWQAEGGAYVAAGDLGFAPEAIHDAKAGKIDSLISRILTDIVSGATYSQKYYYQRNGTWYEANIAVPWNENTGDPTLREYFRWITGDSQLMTGAGANLERMLTDLYRRLLRFQSLEEDPFMHTVNGVQYPAVLSNGGSDTFTYAHLYEGLRDTLVNRFTGRVNFGDLRIDSEESVSFAADSLRNYPSSLGLPTGSAVLRWRGTGFVPAVASLEGVAPMDRFCYMPPLYYRTQTTISTSDDQKIYEKYTQDAPSWLSILGQYRQGKEVTPSTYSVALDSALQYGCGLLALTVAASTAGLPDNDDDDRTVCMATGTNFPVTGILVGSQYAQDFAFCPDTTGTEYNLYDRQVSGLYLTTEESAEARTLVLPTPRNRDVYFYLELRNDSGASFTGAEGIILPGQYFYLAGRLEHSAGSGFPQVFMPDHVTTAHCVVSSMENAHICVPEMGNPQLSLGVRTRTDWIMAASSYVILD